MEPEGFNIVSFILQYINADSIWSILSAVGIASVIQAYVSSKSSAKNPILNAIDQLVRDLLNIVAFNINKAKNKDDPR